MKSRRMPVNLLLCLSLAAALSVPAAALAAATSTSPAKAVSQANAPASEAAVENAPIEVPDGFAFSADAACGACHLVEAAAAENDACLSANPAHAALACTDCHEADASMEKAHKRIKTGDMPAEKLRRTTVDPEVCSACHKEADLAKATSGTEVLTDDQGLTVNPHDLPAVKAHETVVCSNCHKMHDTEPLEETAQAFCASCHHANVYECGTCH